MDIHVSLVGRGDLAGEIYRQLREAILVESLRPGDRLPPTRELAKRLSVSRTTVTVAYDRLAAEGFVEARVGAGTYVRERVRHGGGRRAGTAPDSLRARRVWDDIPLSIAFVRKARYDLRSGLTDASMFPFEPWRRLVARELRPRAIGGGIYGPSGGDPSLREAIARHIAVSRGVEAMAEDVTITNGTQQALDVLARAFTGPGDVIAVEDPGYPPPRYLFRSLGACVEGVPIDEDGLVVDALPKRARMVYLTPSHQYPLGMTMALERRIALLGWAEENDAAIIEDDYDSEFRFGGRPIEPLRALDRTGRVAYVGSFSKTLLPTLRLGFVVTPPSLRDAVQKAKYVTDWHTPSFTQRALARFIDSGGFARHVRKMNRVYQARHELVTDILAARFADHVEVVPSAVGIHIGALARTASVEEIRNVARRASADGVEIQILSAYAVTPPGRAGIVLGYGAIPVDDIPEALRILLNAFRASSRND